MYLYEFYDNNNMMGMNMWVIDNFNSGFVCEMYIKIAEKENFLEEEL